jgi:FkbM family methyltransferase
MKSSLQRFLQAILGFRRYLIVFSIYKIFTLRFDRGERDFFYFLELLEKQGEGIILDVGANIGIMTYHLSKRNSDRKVLSFEPVKENLYCLRKIASLFRLDNVEIRDTAAGEQTGTLEMVMPEIDGVRKQGLSHLVQVNPSAEGQRYTVGVEPLDKLKQEGHKISGIKLDVENFEYHALRGAQQILVEDRPVIYCELWDNQNRQDCFRFIKELKYEIRVLDKQRLVEFDENQHNTQNFFFV